MRKSSAADETPRSKAAAAPTPRPSSSSLVSDVLAAFAPFISSRSPGMTRALSYAAHFATVDRTVLPEEVVVDKAALLAGILSFAAEEPKETSSATWLAEWLRSKDLVPNPRGFRASENVETTMVWESGASVVASRSLRARVFPRAEEIARRTVGRKVVDLRHVIFALLDEKIAFGSTEFELTAQQRRDLKKLIVNRIAAYPERREKITEWRKLAADAGSEGVRTLSDTPATVDALGRKAFADVLAARIVGVGKELRTKRTAVDASFILHMDGPWGSGKSTILNFLKANLQKQRPSWLVVEFNAWQNQNRRPAWWPLVLEVRSAAVRSLGLWTPVTWLAWLWWRIRMDWLPYLLAVAFALVAAYFASSARIVQSLLGTKDMGNGALNAVTALLAAVGSLLAMLRGFTLGSQRNAETYIETKSEPFRRVLRLFTLMVKATHRPIAVFIDDLDRCDGDYVIDLLEGIQTSLRARPIVYVVAGDRKWICSSFERRYVDFKDEIGAPGRPLGYLFLDKVFQVSTTIPQLSTERQTGYWRHLLDPKGLSDEAERHRRDEAETSATEVMGGRTSHEQIQAAIDAAPPGTIEQETLRAAAARQITSAEAVEGTEHRLQPLAPLLEPNPRSMKRLVNAYGLNQARAYLEARDLNAEALARWTIVELRWPKLADAIASSLAMSTADRVDEAAIPASLHALWNSREVKAVLGRDGDEGQLTVQRLREILA